VGKSVVGGLQKAQKISDDVLGWMRNNPDKIDMIRDAAQGKNEAIANISNDLAQSLSEKFSAAVSKQNQTIDDIVAIAGDAPINKNRVLNAFDAEVQKLQKGNITPPVQSAISALEAMRDKFIGKGEVNADQVNILRKEVNNLASPAYEKAIGDNPVLAQSASKVGNALRSTLDEVDALVEKQVGPMLQDGQKATIRGANQALKKLLDLRENVASKFSAPSFRGLNNQIDPSDVQKDFNGHAERGEGDVKAVCRCARICSRCKFFRAFRLYSRFKTAFSRSRRFRNRTNDGSD
jgi:hypothetical protein